MEHVEALVPGEVVQPPMSPVGSVAKEVFDNHLIRETILNFAIHEANGKKILRGTIGFLRLVQKSWVQTIAKLFNKNGDPLYQLVLDGNNSLYGSVQVKENGKILDRFVDSVTSENSPIHDCIPTFSLYIRPAFFRLQNYKSLYNCLRLCGAQLLEVKLEVPVNGGSLPGRFPGSLSLGRLKQLSVTFTRTVLPNMKSWESVISKDSNTALVIQTLLSGATALTEFQVPRNGSPTEAPLGFEFLALPITITKMKIICKLETSQMELLAHSKLPHLTDLRFFVSNCVYENEVLFRIFDNLRFTLRCLFIIGEGNIPPLRNTHLYRFPVMQKLETFKTSSIHSGLEANQLALETCLPKLFRLTLWDQTELSFRNWTENSTFSSVDTLQVLLANGDFDRSNRDYVHNLDMELMQRLHITFPNVTQLQLGATATTTTCGFKYIFKEMRQLTSLTFNVMETSPEVGSEVFWDALLIGMVDNLQLATSLRASPDIWPSIDINNEGMLVSIKMLTNLKCLKLLDEVARIAPRDTSKLLISDMAFHYALLKMKNLTRLVLQGRFKASDTMTQKWKGSGKILVYSPPQADGVQHIYNHQ